LLWVGWFGFNAGSALGANGLAVSAFVATHVAAAAASVSWLLTEWGVKGKPTVLGGISGAVAGLVAVTPACGFVTPMGALVIGLAGGVACFYACHLKGRFGYDDSLDVVGVHGVGGTTGAILTGVFCTTTVNAAGKDGLLSGNPVQVWAQVESVLITMVFCFVGAWVLLKVVDALVGLRVTEEEEVSGLDLSQHGENAYQP
ncbi:MAG TPA: ammonia channel protein, partial [Terriglobales bacterium]|nr:ammonia channel protein [Terriglobales bacterium]